MAAPLPQQLKDTQTPLNMFRTMTLIRVMEERLGEVMKSGELPGPAHLYIGEEAIAAGVCAHLTARDWTTSTHRGHGHFLAKGGNPAAMVAEVYGRATGVCQGKGGSMHVADFGQGILGANGIVGGGIGLATGAALAAQLEGKGAVAVAFFGDGAANQGVVMEALNVSALWKLPLILMCENNGFSEFSKSATVTAGQIADRAKPYGVPGRVIDGNDVFGVWQAADEAVQRARSGKGPSLLEATTYRIRGHVETESSFLTRPYRDPEEIERWKARDPIPLCVTRLLKEGMATQGDIDRVVAEVRGVVDEAFKSAAAAPWPDESLAFQHMFA